MLWNQETTSGTITFLDNHSIEEFDEIKFIYGIFNNNDNKYYLNENNISKMMWEYIKNDQNRIIELESFDNHFIDLHNLSNNSLEIYDSKNVIIFQIYGIKY